jgi:hypothetical protein
MAVRQYLVNNPTFIRGAYHPRGSVVSIDDADVKDGQRNLIAIQGEIADPPAVQVAPVAPTGPNPTAPQQIPPDATQTIRGYEQPGARLVGEVTVPEKDRIEAAQLLDDGDSTQQELVEKLPPVESRAAVAQRTTRSRTAETGQNDDDALVDGTVDEVTADLGSKSDEELDQLRAAERDREKPRAGVLKAIDKEVASRQSA